MNKVDKILTCDEIYRMLVTALREKEPIPSESWSFIKFEELVYRSTKEYQPDVLIRQSEALRHSLYALVEFARQMPERVNLSESNPRVSEMCRNLADEIVKITIKPDEVIVARGKLMIWLKAILAVQPCWIYREETERVIAEREQAKKNRRQMPARSRHLVQITETINPPEKVLAKTILQKIFQKQQSNESEQPGLF